MQANQINLGNLEYLEDLYKIYLEDPEKVQDSWRWFFQGLDFSKQEGQISKKQLQEEMQAYQLVRAYRKQAYRQARINPLASASESKPVWPLADFEKAQAKRMFSSVEKLLGKPCSLEQAAKLLRKSYMEKISLQSESCSGEMQAWLFKEMESASVYSPEQERQAFSQTLQAEVLEKFIHFKFMGKKRFSLEGLEVLLPMMESLLATSSSLGLKEIVIGMAHRGRINMLINFMKQDPKVIFSEFKENSIYETDAAWTGDVKYHLGFISERPTSNGKCRLHMAYNPSHLEAVNSITLGMTRALQRSQKDTQERKTVLPVLIHGDAAFIGQGSVSESLQLSQLKGYTVGGSLHIILNNQLGFTTLPEEGRSTTYSSDLAKSIGSPVIFVNGDSVTDALKAMDIALKFRQKFHQDIFIELMGYRRYGHNEGDEPSFTQPLLYERIKHHKTTPQIYLEDLVKRAVLEEDFATKLRKELESKLEKANQETEIKKSDWQGLKAKYPQVKVLKTSQVKEDVLLQALKQASKEPQNFNLHPKVKKLLKKREELIKNSQVDWALAELAAYGTLLLEGFSIRLSGQDSKRGTFSHRHSVYHDIKTGKELVALAELVSPGKECCLYNSPLSEMASLGFEYGNACMAPDFLTIWEAQFGDFINGAQIIIDNFITSGEQKWLQATDITLLLPHGYEGQGSEHSSGYLERFLQLCAEDNIQVCQPTTPASLFHVLRRQKTLKKPKPLILMTPKSLLRHEKVLSSIQELSQGTFQEVLGDTQISDARDISSLILCTGKVFYDFTEQTMLPKHAALFRLEQLYPFPRNKLNPIFHGMPCLKKIVWLQEEPKNRGAWTFVKEELESMLEDLGLQIDIVYVGRPARAAASEGSLKSHLKEQKSLLDRACRLL